MLSNSIIFILFSAIFSMFGTAGEELAWQSANARNQAVLEAVQASDQASALSAVIDNILNDRRLDGAVAGVSVRHSDTGELLYSHMGNIRLHPASNMKILTAVAALEMLGPDYRFSTELWTDGELKGNVLDGNLYLKGKGDPTLMKADLDRFARELKAKGIERIEGHLIGDDSWYDDIRLSQDLNWSDEPYYTGAQVSALTLAPNTDYDAGTVIVEVSPASNAGGRPQVKVTPATDYVTIVNRAETVARNGSSTISIEREHGSNRIKIEGTIPLGGSSVRSRASVWEPTGYVLDMFHKSLQENGIALGSMSEQLIGMTPNDVVLLASKESIPLSELIIPFMKMSNNGHGETLTKEMGKVIYGEGSWTQGLQVIKDSVVSLGMNGDAIMLRDGSGMSHKTMIPADELSKLLYTIQDRSWYPVFEDSLPVAGAREWLDGGTLRTRMLGTPAEGNVKAKTGSLTSVSSLSGYVTTKDGERLIFSIMINNYLAPTVRPIEDAIAAALAGFEWHAYGDQAG